MENKRKTPGPLAAASLHRIGLPIPTPGHPAWRLPGFVRNGSRGPSIDKAPARWYPKRPLIARSLRFVWHAPLSRSKGGAPAGGHILTGAPPLHLSLPGFVPLPHSPPISSGNLGRESGLHISLSSFLVARFPDPATTPPLFVSHFLHPPLGPKSCTSHLAHHHPSPLAQPFHASLHRMRSWDRQCVAICQSHQAPSTTLPFSPPSSPILAHQPEHGWAHLNPGKDILQSAICNLRPPADTGQRGNHLKGPTSYHIGTAAGCGIPRPCLRRHCEGAVTTLMSSQHRSTACLSVPLACSSSHRHGCCARRRERRGEGRR